MGKGYCIIQRVVLYFLQGNPVIKRNFLCVGMKEVNTEMVYGAIDEKSEHGYTRMGRVFDAIHNKQMEYNWLITDTECLIDKIEECCSGNGYCWLTGEELTKIVREDDGQWIWAVLSGFEKDISLSDVLQYPLPYADGYGGFWKNPLSMQHPLATVEIVPWDSTLTLLLSKQADLVQDFLRFFPLSEDLLTYNAT